MMNHDEKTVEVSDLPLGHGNILESENYRDEHKSNAADRRDMLRMGKTQEMNRIFRPVTMYGFTVILMCSWEVVLSTASLGLGNGGSAGLLYTNLATWVGFMAVYASLGEQGSMAPTSGGQYRGSYLTCLGARANEILQTGSPNSHHANTRNF